MLSMQVNHFHPPADAHGSSLVGLYHFQIPSDLPQIQHMHFTSKLLQYESSLAYKIRISSFPYSFKYPSAPSLLPQFHCFCIIKLNKQIRAHIRHVSQQE